MHRDGDVQHADGGRCTRPEPFNFTPMGVNPVSPHVRPMGVHRACGEPDETKKKTHPKHITACLLEQAVCADGCLGGSHGDTCMQVRQALL